MKKPLFILLFVLSFISAKAQPLHKSAEWAKLLTALKAEDWPTANQLSMDCLKKVPADEIDDVEAGLLRYMYIFSEAGLMDMRRKTKEQALKDVKSFKGHFVLLASHPLALKNGFNSIQPYNDKTDSLFITSTNVAATSIFSFEYILPKEKWAIEDFKANVGKTYRIGGRLKSISTEGTIFPRFRIIIDDATIMKEDH